MTDRLANNLSRPDATTTMPILCADDFGLTDGISIGITELARARRLSATSAIVTRPDWTSHASTVNDLRPLVSVGVHLNLTLGQPISPALAGMMRHNRLPAIGWWIRAACLGRIDQAAIQSEFIAQLTRFQETTGVQPDHVDGHQHVHALPMVRAATIGAIQAMRWPTAPLIRTPEDTIANIRARGGAVRKAAIIATLSRGFRRSLNSAGFPSNDTFAGVSAFERKSSYADELAAGFTAPGARHLIMCHPGHPDTTLDGLDPVVERRADELEALRIHPTLPDRIWHPDRVRNGNPIDWQASP